MDELFRESENCIEPPELFKTQPFSYLSENVSQLLCVSNRVLPKKMQYLTPGLNWGILTKDFLIGEKNLSIDDQFRRSSAAILLISEIIYKEITRLETEDFLVRYKKGIKTLSSDSDEATKIAKTIFENCKSSNEIHLLHLTELFVQIERKLRLLYVKSNDQKHNKCPNLLIDLLRSELIQKIIGKDGQFLFLVLIGPSIGLNLRNIVWHGFLSPKELPPKITLFLFIILLSFQDLIEQQQKIEQEKTKRGNENENQEQENEIKDKKENETEDKKEKEKKKEKENKNEKGKGNKKFQEVKTLISSDFVDFSKYEQQFKSLNGKLYLKSNTNYLNLMKEIDLLLSTSYFFPRNRTNLIKQMFHIYFKESSPFKVLFILFPILEHGLRISYVSLNNLDQKFLTAESNVHYTSFQLFFEKSQNNKLFDKHFINKITFQFLFDFLKEVRGPRIRDRIAHGMFVENNGIPEIMIDYLLIIFLIFCRRCNYKNLNRMKKINIKKNEKLNKENDGIEDEDEDGDGDGDYEEDFNNKKRGEEKNKNNNFPIINNIIKKFKKERKNKTFFHISNFAQINAQSFFKNMTQIQDCFTNKKINSRISQEDYELIDKLEMISKKILIKKGEGSKQNKYNQEKEKEKENDIKGGNKFVMNRGRVTKIENNNSGENNLGGNGGDESGSGSGSESEENIIDFLNLPIDTLFMQRQKKTQFVYINNIINNSKTLLTQLIDSWEILKQKFIEKGEDVSRRIENSLLNLEKILTVYFSLLKSLRLLIQYGFQKVLNFKLLKRLLSYFQNGKSYIKKRNWPKLSQNTKALIQYWEKTLH
ncbi:endoplasmic reticulum membrane-associated RNA degradation protein [Anaeramoeba flamelloides]|uniref:Endoplasmic reticulum membrane-associated RNA degradation protein n=1 Tax=Anaeramoeba flamelloides TaxID=1746091 RepID=A0ABQ8XL59_9EUKA|nr:endoplasmic reticulum membrane-associated RNA degradation protein [Anaeramoeba flamelloides]